MGRTYLVRYGVARAIGRLAASESYPRGQTVVIRTHRGTELGEVLLDAPDDAASPPGADAAQILRAADADDLERARRAALDAPRRYEACRAIFDDGAWPIDPIDAESLLDDGRTVLHYLGPSQLDGAGLVAALRDRCGLDVVLEPAGVDAPEPDPGHDPESGGGCGAGGCGTGGCGSAKGGCGGCPVKKLAPSGGHRAPVPA